MGFERRFELTRGRLAWEDEITFLRAVEWAEFVPVRLLVPAELEPEGGEWRGRIGSWEVAIAPGALTVERRTVGLPLGPAREIAETMGMVSFARGDTVRRAGRLSWRPGPEDRA